MRKIVMPKSAPKPAPVPVKTAAKPKIAAVPRVEHQVKTAYDGPSLGLNTRKSYTKIDLRIAGTAPDLVLTTRTESLMNAMRAHYGVKPFTRGNLDAGVIKYLLRKGVLRVVSGDGDENTTFAFAAKGTGKKVA